MNESEKLLDFIDGGLTLEEEQSLFYELSTNDELRQMLKHLMAIEQSVSANPSFYAPTVSSTNAIFTKLGFTPPKSIINQDSTVANGSISSIFKNLYIIIPTLSILILSGLGYLYFSNSNNSNLIEPNVSSRIDPKRNIAFIEQSETAASNLSENSNSLEVLNNNENQISKFVNKQETGRIITNEDNINGLELNDAAINTFTNLNKVNHSSTEKSLYNLTSNNNSFGLIFNPESFNSAPTTEFFTKISIDLHKHNFTHALQPTIEPAKDQTLKDVSLAINYNFNEHWQLGIIYMKETFFQIFDGIDEFSRFVIYEQQPVLNTFALQANYKYYLTDKISISPQIAMGFNEGGFVGGAGLSTNYNIYSGISLNFGVEAKTLLYEFQGKNFNSTKYGTNFGISYNFR